MILIPEHLTAEDLAWLTEHADLAGCPLVAQPPVLRYDPALISYLERHPKRKALATSKQ